MDAFPIVDSEEIMENVRLFRIAIKKVVPILNERYVECDSKGHQKPDEENNYCNYCHRHLRYKTPRTDAMINERKKLPWYNQPFDAPLMIQERERESGAQKLEDNFKGLIKLSDELGL